MRTYLQVLSQDERAKVHERSLEILANTGVRVDTAQGRSILQAAGATIDTNNNLVRLPEDLVNEALRLAPRDFSLGARRDGWDLRMNAGDCTLLIDGEAVFVLDRDTGERRPGTVADWLEATRLIDALDEIGVYWAMIERHDAGDTVSDYVTYLRKLFANFSKHVQDAFENPDHAPWLLEVLQVVFGDQTTIRKTHPLSFLLCPQSPLVIEGPFTDAYLALLGWDIPVAVMPMPLMGATAPGSLISTVILGNCDVLAMLCLIQAAAPGTPFIYAPALATMDPRSGRYTAGAIENALLGSAAIEMARYYGLPVEGTGGGTDHYTPGIQAGYEGAAGMMLPVLSWPDILVGPGLLGGSMVLSLEQLLIDVETFKYARRAAEGIATDDEKWLESVIGSVGPGGHFIEERSTIAGIRGGEWYIPEIGLHDTYEHWEAIGKPSLLEEVKEKVTQILTSHEPLPLDEDVERELDRIQAKARKVSG